MNPAHESNADSTELLSLAERWLEGVISADEKQRLEQLLLSDRRRRDQFVQHVQLSAGLHWMFSAANQVADVIDPEPEGESRPAAIIAQRRLGLSNDENFIRGYQRCAAREPHLQAWLQIYPRIRAATCLARGGAAGDEQILGRIVEAFLVDYAPGLTTNELWRLASRSVLEVLGNVPSQLLPQQVLRALCSATFAAAEPAGQLDTIAVCELLDEHVPHKFSPDALRLLYLRYLHGLAPAKVALHLRRPASSVRLQLAALRLDLVQRCLNKDADDQQASDADQLAWRSWNSLLDGEPLSREAALQVHEWIASSPDNATRAILAAIIHDYLGRQLLAVRLLHELGVRNDQSYVQAVEQSLRDIELLATPLGPPAPSARTVSSGPVKLAAALGLAAGLLLSVGLGLWGGKSPTPPDQPATDPPSVAQNDLPAPKPRPSEPPLPPVVAVVSESLGLASGDSDRIGIGTLLRQGDAIAFDQGIAQISTTTGSTLVLEGPIQATAESASLIALGRGKLTGLNASRGEALVIQTPHSRVTDLGTEFGVRVTDNQVVSVSVYEGEVELANQGAADQQTTPLAVQLTAGWEAQLDRNAALAPRAVPLTHQREFVRVDEVQLRKEARAGVDAALTAVDFYELLRVDDLIAYQGFDVDSQGTSYTIGFRDPPIRRSGRLSFGPNVGDTAPLRGRSGSLEASDGVSFFLDLDTSERSFLAKANLVDDDGLVGQRPGELWLAWRTQIVGAEGADFDWAGLSLMFGNDRTTDEPLFVGVPAGMNAFGLHVLPSLVDDPMRQAPLDQDPQLNGVQAVVPDNRAHLWVMRLRMDGDQADAAVWCDVPPDLIADTSPQLLKPTEGLRFDRLRLEARPTGGVGAWLFDDITLAASLQGIADVLHRADSRSNDPQASVTGP